MQETMNKMVSGVRYSIIGPEDASRTIHGCATLLGLQLVDDLPETTIIITGMPKTIDKDILINVFKEYGEISDAAMASKARGFGELKCIENIWHLSFYFLHLTRVCIYMLVNLKFRTCALPLVKISK